MSESLLPLFEQLAKLRRRLQQIAVSVCHNLAGDAADDEKGAHDWYTGFDVPLGTNRRRSPGPNGYDCLGTDSAPWLRGSSLAVHGSGLCDCYRRF